MRTQIVIPDYSDNPQKHSIHDLIFDIDKKHLSEINKLYSKYDPPAKERSLMKVSILNGLAKRGDTLYKMICGKLKGMGWEANDFCP